MLVETETIRLADVGVHVMVVVASQVIYLWANTQPLLGALTMAMPSRLDATPLGMVLKRGLDDDLAESFAKRLARKFGVQVFVSCELPRELADLREGVEKRLTDTVKGIVERPDVQAALFPAAEPEAAQAS
ncbi:hypothetical protein PTSG_05893 [Salpingoeca rosetta]|uniref:Proteasome assembly chaperone 3 n=1 Tax=Salpingoeca rosetta (strain ATCC 50818 / BSB-021) TaxID=946362 RepID=F2UD34_SALR5|nr:uncharacterized protein PTSG_05893 [Salpingoeca rosetta]EGD74529.1 hypothetical protein PTSG_05893 [Salpingoeca rosetta]|eukprot:XP_004992786.1 hypothetical protein PTSG_05893 [Salpingoeca rosetta]